MQGRRDRPAASFFHRLPLVAAVLSIQNLVKVYPSGTRAIDDVTLDIQHGEFVVLIGLSGSGKLSLLRCINRLVEPTSGRIVFDGADVTRASGPELRRIRRRIGMIFQQFNLVRRTSVLSNTLAGRLGYRTTWRTIVGRPSAQDVAAAFENLGRVGIADKAFSRADALSGGQQQRVGIARALMQAPDLMLADEPHGGRAGRARRRHRCRAPRRRALMAEYFTARGMPVPRELERSPLSNWRRLLVIAITLLVLYIGLQITNLDLSRANPQYSL